MGASNLHPVASSTIILVQLMPPRQHIPPPLLSVSNSNMYNYTVSPLDGFSFFPELFHQQGKHIIKKSFPPCTLLFYRCAYKARKGWSLASYFHISFFHPSSACFCISVIIHILVISISRPFFLQFHLI